MLVLAIIVMIGSMVTPMLGEVFERQKLRGAAERIRLAWDDARLQAMKTGQAQVFTCVPTTGSYSIKPLVLQSDSTNVGEGATLVNTAGMLVETQDFGYGMTGVAATPDTAGEQLEDKIVFVGCRVSNDMRSYSIAQESQTMGTGELDTQSVAQSVIFYPDGSTSTAEVQLQNERGDIRGVQIRGLTGHCRVVDVSNVPSTNKES